MKKDKATPDMFGDPKPEAKPKQDAPAIHRKGTYTASEMVGGIPAYLERIREAAGCIESRCDSATRTKELTASQCAKLKRIAAELRGWLHELSRIRKEVDGLIAAGVAMPEKSGGLEL